MQKPVEPEKMRPGQGLPPAAVRLRASREFHHALLFLRGGEPAHRQPPVRPAALRLGDRGRERRYRVLLHRASPISSTTVSESFRATTRSSSAAASTWRPPRRNRLWAGCGREARRGVAVGGLCNRGLDPCAGGPSRRQARHDPLGEPRQLPRGVPRRRPHEIVFVTDGNRFTTAGGTSSIDLMLKIISDDHGEGNSPRKSPTSSSTPRSAPTRTPSVCRCRHGIGVRHPKLAQVIQMNGGRDRGADQPRPSRPRRRPVDAPARTALPALPQPLAETLLHGVAACRRRATSLMQTEMSVINVALACGFTSPLAFLEVLPGALQHDPLPRTRRAGPEALGLKRRRGISAPACGARPPRIFPGR